MFVYRYSVFVLGTSTTGKPSPGAGTHHASMGSPTPEREGGNILFSCYFFLTIGGVGDKEGKPVSDKISLAVKFLDRTFVLPCSCLSALDLFQS